ncbi:MAG: hypothetical protein WBA02_01585 [Jannaschia helgolandensis]|uniref:Uncharacterized protein n=1 Tax=Jannaschia helgolandensis TaxID=188906 RepID=A0A1H7KQN9_9RHOB|nr:hypothetical protein [Jannaschia helgolandensis]SEK88826.1 hypothetical protein SAMN04488526_1471 [Jannaschia helgolandensis]
MAVLRFIYALYLRLTGLGLLFMVFVYFGLKTNAGNNLGVTIPPVELWVQATLAGLGVFLLIPWWLPRGLRRPTQGRDLIWLSVHGIIVVVYPLLLEPMLAAILALPDIPLTAAQQKSASPMWSLFIPFGLMLLLVMPDMRRQKPPRPDPNDPARAIPVAERKPVPIADFNKKLPAIGGAMKLYVAADWLILRLLGLGLMGTAYLLWDMISTGRTFQAGQLAFGNDPTRAMYAYAAVGAIIALPFLLPRRIAAPRHVGFGLVKAVILVAVAFVLITPLSVAIELFAPEAYRPTLIATVPNLFKAIAGIAVTSVLLIAFFRQLNTLPAVDYKGDPKVSLSQQQLHDLRLARMGQP